MYSTIFQFQILLILPLNGTRLSLSLGFYLRYLQDLLFSYNFIPDSLFYWGIDSFEKYDFDRPETYTELIGLKYASSLANSARILFALVHVVLMYGAVAFI